MANAITGLRLIVFFDDPFWVGVFERIENGKLTVSKVTFELKQQKKKEKHKGH